MLAPAAFPAFFLTLAGFILLLLVTLSTPIIHSIYLLEIESSNVAVVATAAVNGIKFGVFGLCYEYSSIHSSSLARISQCTSPEVGYAVDISPSYFGIASDTEFDKVIIKGLAGSLVLNPLACGVAGVGLFFALLAYFFASRVAEIFTFILLLFAQVVAWIAFFLDLALALVARHRTDDDTKGVYTGHLGNAIWLALAGALALSFANCFAGCGVFGRYSSFPRGPKGVVATAPPPPEGAVPPRRRFFWQRDPARGTY